MGCSICGSNREVELVGEDYATGETVFACSGCVAEVRDQLDGPPSAAARYVESLELLRQYQEDNNWDARDLEEELVDEYDECTGVVENLRHRMH